MTIGVMCILSIVIVIHVSTSVNGTYSVRPFRMESPMNTCMKGTRIGKWTSGRSVALSIPRRRIYQNHSERKCSVSYPCGERSGHSVSSATSGILRSTYPCASTHLSCIKPSLFRLRLPSEEQGWLCRLSHSAPLRCAPFPTPHMPWPQGRACSVRFAPSAPSPTIP